MVAIHSQERQAVLSHRSPLQQFLSSAPVNSVDSRYPVPGAGGKAGKHPRAPPTEAELAAREQLDRLTEAASALMDSGELDVYSKRQVRRSSATAATGLLRLQR